ncbi:hypothetical protein FDP41_013606 [Naegleria fowleri]|uniref:Uncharacterized protein n=1 Tax=Naegleria fowleri TaxID=5763 RepID=A0A6A5C0S0_NAEFO|nr:uncharacterized protein FDP41_013606 [Naegleria fowleri]KAF0980392.1 hypothetical protein FDP41_013606 [Naegleria fowleri]CAG4714628.1 unnamed protein product [Naegleria fowleri]
MYLKSLLLAVVGFLVSLSFVSGQKYTCCMPHRHTVYASVRSMSLSNCKDNQCNFNGQRVIHEKHMPDFFHRRYRLDLKIEMNDKVVSDWKTTMGFMEPYPSNFGIEYIFNATSCTCHQLTKQSPYLMVSCVDADYTLESVIDVGIETMEYVKGQRYVRTLQLNGTHTQRDVMVVQQVNKPQPPFPHKYDPYPADYDCAILYSETKIETRDHLGNLKELQTISSHFWNFKPFNTDADYVVPSYCPKCN